jgi:hypothetical protein
MGIAVNGCALVNGPGGDESDRERVEHKMILSFINAVPQLFERPACTGISINYVLVF